MKKVKLFLVFALLLTTALCTTACTQELLSMVGLAQTCAVHRDINRDNVCDVCGSEMPVSCKRHEDLDHDGVCDTEGCGHSMKVTHYDDDHDGKCDELYCTEDGMDFEHYDDDYDRKCDACDAEIEIDCECYDDDGDGFCDECEYPIIICNHRDINKDGFCDKCEEPMPACSHNDEDGNGVCELCKEPMPGTIPLVDKNGASSYKFVLGTGLGSHPRRLITYLMDDLDSVGVTVEENKGAAVDYEVLFGAVTGRDSKYTLDVHDYGIKGYTIQVIDNKIVVLAGSEDAYIEAIELLRTEFFGLPEDMENIEELKNVHIYSDKNITKVQDDYKITQITLFGEDIRDYKIAYDTSDFDARSAAGKIQTLLYEKSGYWLETASSAEVTDKAIFVKLVDKCGETGFEAIFEEGKITFTSEYATTLGKVPYDFFLDMLTNTVSETKTLALTDANEQYERFTKNAHYVYYDDFGAKGDGLTNDADAIYEAHQFANNGKHKKVIGTSGKTYLIETIKEKAACIITCDVDWTDVKFIIDDRDGIITNGHRGSVFEVRGSSTQTINSSNSDFLRQINAAGGFKASDMDKFDLGLGYAAMVTVINGDHKHFIRLGVNANGGSTQSEIILIDAEGNIDPRARFLFDYEKVTSVTVYRIDTETIKPIVIDGGEFTTRAHNQNKQTAYTGQRGIMVYRPHTTIKNLKHYVTGEVAGDKGSAYPSFIDIQSAYNILITDCVFTARKTYKTESGVGLGTYDIVTHDSLEVTWKNCIQTNFYKKKDTDPPELIADKSKGRDEDHWGISGGGGSKRVTFDGCTLSRFDAHEGIMHAYIINSTVGSVDVTGGGNLHITNSKIYAWDGAPMIRFREDYGAFWIGDVVVKDSAIIDKNDNIVTALLFNTSWSNHYFGYTTSLPTSIIIDDVKVLTRDLETLSAKAKSVNIFSTSFVNNSDKYNAQTIRTQQSDGTYKEVNNKNIMTPPGSIIVRNNNQNLTYNLSVFEGKEYFKDTHIEEIPVGEIPECTGHADEDGDFTCDTCWEYIPASVCRVHSDTDHDGYCDVLVCKTKLTAE